MIDDKIVMRIKLIDENAARRLEMSFSGDDLSSSFARVEGVDAWMAL